MDCELWLISFSALVSSCTGHSELICSPQPITVLAGDDVILPCCLESAISATSGRVEWTKPGLDPEYVHVHHDGRLQYQIQNPSYYYRTRLFVDELGNGNVSMKIFKVKISDKGTYKCFLPSEQQEAFVQLNVGSVSSPVVTMTNSTTSGVMLDCECAGWYPEPQVLWLDAEGNLLSAGPTETVRGPDDLYTVSSRLTVEKRHSNSFTCRVQQKDIHQTRETQIHVEDDFFKTLSSPNPSVRIIIIIIGPVGIMFIAVAFLMWKRGPKIIKTKRNQPADDERRKQENPELQSLAEGETEKPGTQNQSANTEMHLDTGEVKKKNKTVQRRLFTAEGERN